MNISHQYQGDRIVSVYQNGDIQQRKFEVISLSKNLDMRQLFEIIRFKFHLKERKFRLFNTDGVELYQEDLPYVKHKAVLYFSRGEEFDARSSFSEYETIKELGEGGFGRVVLGQHRQTGQKVAIKIVKTGSIGNAEQIDMVFREAEMLKSLHHKNIVRIQNCYTLPNMEVVFIMEYLEGGELLQYVQNKGHLSEEEACEFFVQITEGISYCHQQKLIHRDLKLENVLLAKEDKKLVKIIDFGIAGLANNFNISKIDMGTLRYMPPEILLGRTNEISFPIDVWALGIILYAMVIGTLPFDGENNEEITKQITKLKYRVPNECSDELKNVFQRIFVLDPHKRIKISQLLEHPWIALNCKAQDSETGYRLFIQQQGLNRDHEKRNAQAGNSKTKRKKKVGIVNEADVPELKTVNQPSRDPVHKPLKSQFNTVRASVDEIILKQGITQDIQEKRKQRAISHIQDNSNRTIEHPLRSLVLPNVGYNIIQLQRQLRYKQTTIRQLLPRLARNSPP